MTAATRRLRSTGGTTMMEYALVLIVIGLAVLFIATRFGTALRARYGAVKSTVNMTKINPGHHVEVDDEGLTGTAASVPDQ